jgi:hypothetical protein
MKESDIFPIRIGRMSSGLSHHRITAAPAPAPAPASPRRPAAPVPRARLAAHNIAPGAAPCARLAAPATTPAAAPAPALLRLTTPTGVALERKPSGLASYYGWGTSPPQCR